MNLTPLLDLVELPKLTVEVPLSGGSRVLHNEYGVLLFESMHHKRAFYKDFTTDWNDLIVVECGIASVAAIADFSSALIVPCSSRNELLNILQGIPLDSNDEISSRHLNTLIIENLSAFYWDLACEQPKDRYAWYHHLNSELTQLKKKYGCNVLVTGWNIEYDRGCSARRPLNRKQEKLNDLTFFPGELFRGASQVLHYGDECLEYRKNVWRAVVA